MVVYIWASVFGTHRAHIFECDGAHEWFCARSQHYDTLPTVHVQNMWQLPAVDFWALLMFAWSSRVCSRWGHCSVCRGRHRVQYSASSVNDTLKHLPSISWLWAFFCPICYNTPLLHLPTCGHHRPAWHYCTSLFTRNNENFGCNLNDLHKFY